MVKVTSHKKPSPHYFTFSPSHQQKHRHCGIIAIRWFLLALLLAILYAVYINLIAVVRDGVDRPILTSSTFAHLFTTAPKQSIPFISGTNSHNNDSDGQDTTINQRQDTTTTTHDNIIKIAHAISLIKCAKEASVTGFLDAAAVLRHSIHKTSWHTKHPDTRLPMSKYSYQMYAIVHAENCASQAPLLEALGYTTLIRHNPVNLSDIINESYRKNVPNENCCGLDEFIKLHAYTLEDHPIVVHWDLDVALLQPLDELYDSMLYDKTSPAGQAARAKVQLSYPQQRLPDRIDAFYTKDITSSQPWELRQGIQGGFLIARPSQELFDKYVAMITQGNYLQGRGNGFGWAGMGHGGFQGAMAYQGATAYMYDVLVPGVGVPVNPCVYNQVVADVLWRGPVRMEHHLQCRQYPHEGYTFENNTLETGACQDCRITPVAETKSVHYTVR